MRRPAKNPWIGVNYVDDNSKMEVPPAYWLQRLYDFDAELVVFPSRYKPFSYVLARRQRLAAGMKDKALEATITQPDTKLCLALGLVPITMIFRTGVTWSIDNIIAQLKARDIWAMGGGDKAADSLDAAEEKVRQDERKATRDDMWMRSGAAWEGYKRRTGQRVSSSGMGTERHLPKTSSSGSTAGSGIVLATR